jgi:hypothetical protein
MAVTAGTQPKEPERSPRRAEVARADAAMASGPDLIQQPVAGLASRFSPLLNRHVARLQHTAGNRTVARRIAAAGHVATIAGPSTTTSPIAAAPPGVAMAIQRATVTLTQEKKWATKGYLAWFQDKVKDIAEGWGLTFDPASVTLGKVGTGKKAKSSVILTWDKGWGAAPHSTEIPFSMEPIKARMAVAGVQKLAGWAKVTKADQTRLNHLLCGETNELSAAARNHLFATFGDLSKKSAKLQAKALKATLTATAAQPDVVAEPVTTAKVGYKLEGPKTQKNYEFRGAKATAEIWKIKFDDGVEIELVAPKSPKKGLHNHTVKQTAESASYVAKAARSVVKTILLNANTNPDDPHWAVEYKTPDFHSYMTAGVAGVVTIYPDKKAKALPTQDYMRGTMVHESGHTWSYKNWGTDTAKGKWLEWKKAMTKDKVSVSDYATKSISEDVAETIQIYVTTQGSKRWEEYKGMVPARFAILEREYK